MTVPTLATDQETTQKQSSQNEEPKDSSSESLQPTAPSPCKPVPPDQDEARKLATRNDVRQFVDSDPLDSQAYIRSAIYSGIISKYNTDLKKRLNQNLRFKEVMFWTCIGILVAVTIVWAITIWLIVNKSTSNNIFDFIQSKLSITTNIALLSTAIIPFITAFIALPHTIATNLFDHTDDKTLKDVLGQMLEYDRKPKK